MNTVDMNIKTGITDCDILVLSRLEILGDSMMGDRLTVTRDRSRLEQLEAIF